MMLERSMILACMLALAGCVGLTPGGEAVKYVTKAEAPAQCELLGEVDVGSANGLKLQVVPSSMAQAKMLMRNQTAEQGGNFLVIDGLEAEEDQGTTKYVGSGRAYRCPDPNAVAAPAPATAGGEAQATPVEGEAATAPAAGEAADAASK